MLVLWTGLLLLGVAARLGASPPQVALASFLREAKSESALILEIAQRAALALANVTGKPDYNERAKAWAEASRPGVPAQQVGPAWVTTTPSQAAATSSQGAAAGSPEGTEASDPATTSGQQAAEPEDGGPDSGDGG